MVTKKPSKLSIVNKGSSSSKEPVVEKSPVQTKVPEFQGGSDFSPQKSSVGAGSAALLDFEEGGVQAQILEALKTVYDPEIPVNIVDLGLIYDIALDDQGSVQLTMTLTAPGCPVAGMIVDQVKAKIAATAGVSAVKVDLVWDPPWCQDRMSESAKLALNLL